MQQPKIDVRVPYEPQGQLGWDYNRILNESPHDWILFIDHDIILNTNPMWYEICQRVISIYPDTALFSCKTNTRFRSPQIDIDAPKTFDINDHQIYSKLIWDKYQFSCKTISKYMRFAGFFFLVNKQAALSVGGFPGIALLDEDWEFTHRLHQHDLPVRLIEGLYIFHAHKRLGTWYPEFKTTLEIAQEYYKDKK